MFVRWMFTPNEGAGDLDGFTVAIYISISVALVLLAGLVSGLTLGLMSLDMVDLEVLKRSGTASERRCAARIIPVVKHQHFVLVTLLICNAAANEALPIFIDRLADPITAVLVSVTVVLIFGEILPQAVCTRYGLQVGAYSAWFVQALMCLCSPIAWPISKLLDFLLGPDHSALFRRGQLKALVDLHSETAGLGGTLSSDEINIIRGALDLTSKTALQAMTPISKVFMLSTDAVLDERTLDAILASGHSRVPVYQAGDRCDIIGIILVKELVLVDPEECVPVRQLRMRMLPRLPADTAMYDMLKLFETGRSHMAILTRPESAVAGVEGPGGKQSRRGSLGNAAVVQHDGAPELEPLLLDAASAGNSPRAGDDPEAPAPRPHAPIIPPGPPGEPVGLITIEDVIEELLQEEIVDETDLWVDNEQTARVNVAALTKSLPPRLRKVLSAGLFTPRVGRLAKGVMSPRSASGPAGVPGATGVSPVGGASGGDVTVGSAGSSGQAPQRGLSASPVAHGNVSSTAEAGAGSRQHPPHPHSKLSQVYPGPKPAMMPQQGQQQQGQHPQQQPQPQQPPAATAAVLAGGDGLWDMAAELRHQKQQAKQQKQAQAQQQT